MEMQYLAIAHITFLSSKIPYLKSFASRFLSQGSIEQKKSEKNVKNVKNSSFLSA